MSLFPIAGLEPLGQQLFVHGDMLPYPRVAEFIETSPEVSLLHPRGAGLLGEPDPALFQGIGTPAALAETIGVPIGQGLGYGGERKRVEGLLGAVVQGGDAQGTQFAVWA